MFLPFGIRIEFWLFALTLLGIAVLPRRALSVARCGLLLATYKLSVISPLQVMRAYVPAVAALLGFGVITAVSSAFMLVWMSAVFDNIPLTKLALEQGGYDWGLLAYTVGFGGSMPWFGSSAGVALCNQYAYARSVIAWLRHGWHVILACVVGFGVYV